MAVSPGVRAKVAQIYPAMLALLDDPEIGPLLAKAVGPTPFSPSRLQMEIQNTKWYKRQSESQRQWLLLNMTDKATAKQQFRGFLAGLQDVGFRFMGKPMASNIASYLTELAMRQGITDPHDPLIMKALRQLYPHAVGGDVGAAARTVTNMAEKEWFLRPRPGDVSRHARRIASGLETPESISAQYAQQALHRYPWLAPRIQAGETLGDITSNQRAIVAEELEMPGAGAVDVMRNSTWRQLLGIHDPKTNKMRMMTDSEVLKLARNRPEWWKTSKGRESDASAVAGLLRKFGERA